MRNGNDSIRRQDRLLGEEAAMELLRSAEYGVLSMQAEEGGGYGVPVHFAWDGASSLLIHGAPEGRKWRCLEHCARASFCVVGRTRIHPGRFSTEYESVLLLGTACTNLDADERMRALILLAEKYLPGDPEACRKYAEALFERTRVIRLDAEVWTGKQCALRP